MALWLLALPCFAAAPPRPSVTTLLAGLGAGKAEADVLAALARVPAKEAAPDLVKALESRDERERRVATLALGAVPAREIKAHLGRIEAMLGDPAPSVVAAAVAAVARLEAKAAPAKVSPLLAHPSVAVRCATAGTLASLKGKPAAAALEARPRDGAVAPEERACLLGALVRLGNKPIAQEAMALVADPDTRELGASVLVVDAKVGLAALDRALRESPSEDLVVGALELAPRFGAAGLAWVGTLLSSPSDTARRAALDLLLANSAREEARALLLSVAAKGDGATRARVIAALTDSKADGLLVLARKGLRDPDRLVRAASARALAVLGDSGSARALVEAYQGERQHVSSENLELRVALLDAVGLFASADLAPMLADACGVAGEERAAVDALVKIGRPAVPTLLLVVKVGDMVRIPFAVEALARIGSGVGQAAEGLFKHPREAVRELGRDLMAASGDPQAVAALLTLFRSEQLEDPVPLVEAIATIATPEARAALFEASVHPNEAVRIAAIDGLGASHARDAATITAIVKVAELDSSVQVKRAAVRALYRLGPPELVPLLQKMVQYEGPDVRTEAIEALGWAGDPDVVPALASRRGDAQGAERIALEAALKRLTRSSSPGSYTSWHSAWRESVDPPSQGARRGTLQRGAVTLHYRTAGSGFAIVAVAGDHPGDLFARALQPLASGYQIVTYDGRGTGSSTGRGAFSLEDALEDLDALRTTLGIHKMTLVGHELGGLVALAYAKAHPKEVNRVVLVSTPARATRGGAAELAARALKGAWQKDLTTLDARHAWYHPAAWLRYREAALAPGYVTRIEDAPRLAAFPVDPIARQALQDALKGAELGSLVGAVKVPVLAIVGEHAPLAANDLALVARLSKSQPRFRLERVPGTSHHPELEARDAFVDLVRSFLSAR